MEGSIFDIFNSVFGGGFSGFSGSSRRRSNEKYPRDLAIELELSFEEAVFGCKKKLKSLTKMRVWLAKEVAQKMARLPLVVPAKEAVEKPSLKAL